MARYTWRARWLIPGSSAPPTSGPASGEVAVRVVPAQQRFPSVAAAVQYRLDSSPDVAKLLADLTEDGREAARAEIEEVVRQFAGPDGVVIPSEWLIGVGAK